MKAQVCNAHGPIDTLQYLEVPDPVADSNEILVDVRAIGVNFADTLVIEGKYQASPPLPFIPGTEIAGEVIAVGDDRLPFDIGDRVHGYSNGFGAYASKAILPHNVAHKLPDNLSFEEGAALMAATGTAHHALRQRACLKQEETLVVLGAAGGTGSAAVQIGSAIGARVIAACSSDEKLDFARAAGAHHCINYSSTDLKVAIKELTSGQGADVIYDTVGGAYFDSSIRSLAWKGRLLVVGFASGNIPQFSVNLALVKGISVVGVFWGTFTEKEPDVHAENMLELYDWIESGLIRPQINARFPLKNCIDALRYVGERKVLGKVVMIP
jgi:NADPH2:quinone reductase